MKNEEITGNFIALLTVMLWGVTFVSTKILLDTFTPAEILVLRFSLGFVALCFIPTPHIPLTSVKREALFALAGLTGVTLYFLFENIALVYTYVSNVGVIVSTAPFFTAILAWLCLRTQKPRPNYYLGFILAMVGIILISSPGAVMQFSFLGDSLALLAAISWAIYSIITRVLSTYGYNSLSITRRVFFYGLLFMLPLVFRNDFQISFHEFSTPINMINLLFLGLGASAMCFVTWTFAVKSLGAAKASLYIYLVPVITILSSSFILNEKIDVYTIVGAALTILGLIISEHSFAKNRELAPSK